jgi:hypothetical protein
LKTLEIVFSDSKTSRQVLNAAKRSNKKQKNSDSAADDHSARRTRIKSKLLRFTNTEESLKLPEPIVDEHVLYNVELVTNRAPLVLAFAVVLLKYSMPEQPLSSRLSLAQAVVSANSRAKAVSIGIQSGKSAEEEGWSQGQPKVRIMGREISVMKRYNNNGEAREGNSNLEGSEGVADLKAFQAMNNDQTVKDGLALWGLDLESLRNSTSAKPASAISSDALVLPIHTPQSARSYLVKSFRPSQSNPGMQQCSTGKKSSNASSSDNEQNLSLLLGALELLFQSWAPVLGKDEIDRKAWTWYVRVRPEVDNGIAGWGAKNKLKLSDILALRRQLQP